jgi:ABC-type multidrug transport system fused ATPase/permease subunit
MNLKKKILALLTVNDKKNFLLLILLMIFAAIIEVFSITLVIPSVSLLLDQAYRIKLINFLEFFNFNLSNINNELLIYIFVFFLLFVFIMKFFYMYFVIYFRSKWAANISARLANNLYASYLSRPYEFHLQKSSSKMILNVTNEVQAFSQNILTPFLEIAHEFLIMLGLLIFMIYVEPIGSLLVLIIGFCTAVIYNIYTHTKTKMWGYERRNNEVEGMKLIQSGLAGIKEVIIFSKKNYFKNEFFHKNLRLNNAYKKQQALLDSSKYYIELIAVISVIGLIFFLLMLNNNETNDILIKLSLFAVIFFKILPALNRIVAAKQRITFSLPSINNIYEEINYFKLFIKEKSIFEKDLRNKIVLKNSIELRNITYSYNGKNKILDNLNLNIKKGEITGIIGHSGAGKSTLVNIITGLLKPDIGAIFVDEVPIGDSIESWQKNIGYVPQNFFMLDDSIRSNILFEPNAASKENDEKIFKSLEKAQMLDFVKSLPGRLDTIIGERGSNISTGQAQRFSIARALYRNPDLLILDEATSSLDPENEEKFLNLVSSFKEYITTIIISHKVNTLKFCNNIYKINNSKIQKI